MAPEFDLPAPEADYNNELSDEKQREIVGQLLLERPPKTKGQFAYYEVTSDSEAADVARTIEAKIFQKHFEETPAEVKEFYGPYEKQSIFFLAVDVKTGKPVGALRAQQNGENGFLTLNDLSEPATEEKGVGGVSVEGVKKYHGIKDLNKCWDIGAVAVLDDYRGDKRTSVMLFRAMYKKAVEEGIEHIISIIDVNPYERSMKPLGIPFKALAGLEKPFRYYGSKLSRAVYGHITGFYPIAEKYRKTPRGRMVNLFAQGALTRLITGNKDDEIQLLVG